MKKLRQEYKKVKDAHNQTGTDRKNWKFYDSVNDILGNRPATCPPIVIDTLDQAQTVGDENSDQDDDLPLGDETAGDTESGNASAQVENSDIESASRSKSNTPVKIKPEKKQKRSKGEVVEDAMSKVMMTVTEGLKESDRMFLELEEKRMKFEEQQKREERQFQLQMMRILVGSSSHPPPHPSDSRSQYYGMYSPFAYPGPGETDEM